MNRTLVARLIGAVMLTCALSAGDAEKAAAMDNVGSRAPTQNGVLVAVLSEENIPAPAESAGPTPEGATGAAPSPSPGASAEQPQGSSALSATPVPPGSPGAAGIGTQPAVMRTEVPPTLDASGAVATQQISDYSLAPQFAAASTTPARAASIRTVERARQEIVAGHADDAIRLLSRSLSIDPSNPYSYFYLGRAYLIKKNYTQALTFFQRAEIGFTSNPVWLGEACGFEGLAYEETGRLNEAAAAYRRGVQASPYNRMALTGYGRLAALGYVGVTSPSVSQAVAPGGDQSAPAPPMPPPPPPPNVPPPPTD
ncbi:MAG TPA: tetratricopeptide repeat protein [Candidatus Binataceae bacterium]|nr:tetratricopeptide repeat protein [Candidatus Binataceae bacterium]